MPVTPNDIQGLGTVLAPGTVPSPLTGADSSQAILAELDRRGITPGQLSGRALQREVRNRQMIHDYGVQDVVAELRRRGVQVDLATEPDRANAAKSKAKLEAIDTDLLARTHSNDPAERNKALGEVAKRATELQYAQQFGEEPPDNLEGEPGSGGVTAAPFDAWLEEKFAAQLKNPGAFSNDPATDGQLRAQFVESKQADPGLKAEYAAYTQEASKRPAVFQRGTPEYFRTLRDKVEGKQLTTAVQAAKVKALPSIMEAQAKATAEAPDKARKEVNELNTMTQNNATLKRFREQAAAVKAVQALASKPNATNADDLSLIYSYVKLLDPGSVVREGEIKLAGQATPALTRLVQRARGLYSNRNVLLDPETRALYLESANAVAKASIDSTKPEFERISALATERGIDPSKIFNAEEISAFGAGHAPASTTRPAATPAPAPATAPVARPAAPVAAPAAAPAKRVNQGGNIFEQQPDGSYKFVGKA